MRDEVVYHPELSMVFSSVSKPVLKQAVTVALSAFSSENVCGTNAPTMSSHC